MSHRQPRVEDSTTDRLPHKPTRDDAAAAHSTHELTRDHPTEGGPSTSAGDPQKVRHSGAANEGKRDPHVTENDEDAPVQDDSTAPNDVPALPANASGRDAVPSDELAEPSDPESMYDRRPPPETDHSG